MKNRWRWALWALLLAASVLQIARTGVTADITAFLPGPADARERLLVDQLRHGPSTRLVVIGLRVPGLQHEKPDAETTKALADASRRLQSVLASTAGIAWVSNGDLGQHEPERDRLFGLRYLLSPGVGTDTFSTDGLRLAFARLQDELVSARGSAIRQIAAADPTLESLRLLEQGSGSLAMARGEAGVWFTAQKDAALLAFETRASGDAVAQINQTIEQARAAAEGVLRDWPAKLTRPLIEFAGAGYFNARSQQAIGGESAALVMLALTMIAALLLAALRSPRILPLALFPVASGALAGYAAVGFGYGSIHATTIGFGVTLLGEAVDYVIYTYVQRDPLGRHSSQFWSKLWLAVLTSLIGFAAMLLSGFQGLQQLGLFSIVGLSVAAACTRFLIPSALANVAATRPARIAIALPRLALHARGLRWPVIALSLLTAAWLQWRDAPLWQDGLDALSSATAEDSARDLRWRMAIGQPDLRAMLVAHADDLETALTRAEAMRASLSGLVEQGRLAGFNTPTTWLPSDATQRARLAALPPPEVLRERIRQAVSGTKLRAQAFEPFVADVERTRKRGVLGLSDLDGTITGAWLKGQIIRSADGVDVLLLLHGADPKLSLDAVLRAEAIPGVSVLDIQREVESLVATFRAKAMRTSLFGAVGILLILASRLRRLAAVGSMFAALAATLLLTSGVLVLGSGSLSVFHLVALLLVIGVASNYTLFFASLSVNEGARASESLSVMLAAGATVIAFALLAWSSAPLLAMIGQTVAVGALIGLGAAMVFSREAS